MGSQGFLINYAENEFNCWPSQTGIVNRAPCHSHGLWPQLSCFVLHLHFWDAAESWSQEDTEHGESKQESQDSRQGRAEAVPAVLMHSGPEPASGLCFPVFIDKIHIKLWPSLGQGHCEGLWKATPGGKVRGEEQLSTPDWHCWICRSAAKSSGMYNSSEGREMP